MASDQRVNERPDAGRGRAELALPGGEELPRRHGRHRAGVIAPIGLAPAGGDPFTHFALAYARQRPGRPVTVLQAGCATAGAELDAAAIRASGHDVTVSMLDDDSPVTRAAVAAWPEPGAATLGELRTIPLTPRSVDIVHCPLLLDRVSETDIVLSRLVLALRPGGLLLLRIRDRDSAAGFLDRRLPGPLRGAIWRRSWPGEPGPHPAIYEPLASARGIQAFAARHGLVIAYRQAVSGPAGGPPPRTILAARKIVAAASGGRLDSAHDELRFVIRKPEDSFARVL
ncbi:MAG: hypothetical protein ACLPN6_23655 [Streptosporangiaceae bacterium]